MKKFVIFLIFFLFLIVLYNKEESMYVMSEEKNENYKYELDFSNENLNFNNFKLKLAVFTSYDFKITKVYIDYNDNIKDFFNKDYFSFSSNNLTIGISRLKEEYSIILNNNYLYDEDLYNVRIRKIEIYTTTDALTIFKDKYPSVIINRVQ